LSKKVLKQNLLITPTATTTTTTTTKQKIHGLFFCRKGIHELMKKERKKERKKEIEKRD
jgi:hypothetical protein